MAYDKSLKENDNVKIQLVDLVRNEGLNITQAANTLGIAPRTAQIFFQEGTQWSKDWWEGFNKISDTEIWGYDKPKVTQTRTSQHTELIKDAIIGFKSPTPKLGEILPQQWGAISDKVEIRKTDSGEDNSRILIISDIHIPYHHPDSLEFLQYLKDKYQPTRIICMGDELDKHALSFHDSDPNLPSAGDELKQSLPVIAQLNKMFPVMDILESNHGSLLYRKAHANGIPKQYLKSYNEVLNVNSNWKWWYDMTITLPNGNKCYFHHGKSANVTKTSQTMSMCAVQGHYHETFKIEYWGNPNGLFWAMQTGCLINDNALAFNYNNVNLKRPIIGTGLIIDSQPILEPMVLGEDGRWILRSK